MHKVIKNFTGKMNLVVILIIFMPLLLNIIWFREGNILGYAESGLPFYNFQNAYDANKDAWAHYALGFPTNISIAAKPSYWFLAQLQNVGIPGFVLQPFFFWIVLVTSGISIYLISKNLFPDLDRKFLLIAVLFYWFNPFSMVNVWNRFLNNFFIFYAVLPLLLLLFIKGLKTKRYIYPILIAIISALFAYAFTSIAFVSLFWLVIFYTSTFYFIFAEKRKKKFGIIFFILTFILWCLANFWWINQVFSYLNTKSFDAIVSSSFKSDSNYTTFNTLSERLGKLTYLFRLKHASFFEDTEVMKWVAFYQISLIVLLEFIIVGIIFIPIILKRKNIHVLFLTGLFILAIFIAKGNSPPLGGIFNEAFLHLPLLQLFRNSFEKIGFILPIAAAPLFSLGSFLLLSIIKPKWRSFGYAVILGWLIIIWGFPFWSREVFTSNEILANKVENGYQVKVPLYYKNAADWLNSQKENFRLTIFPIGGEGITYLWEKGYSGVELSNQILPKTAVSFNTNIPFYDGISSNLERIFLTRQNVSKILDALNSKYISLREDIDWRTRRMRNPASLISRIEKIASASGLEEVKKFDKLSFWEYTKWKDKSIYLTNNLIESRQNISIEDLLNVDTDQPVALYNSEQLTSDELIKSKVINPSLKFALGAQSIEPSIILREDIVFPAVRILPSSLLYPLVLFKERLESTTIIDQKFKAIKKFSLLGKRLVEAEREISRNRFDKVMPAFDNYEKQLKEFSYYYLEDNPNKKGSLFLQEDLYKLFLKHFKIIDHISDISPKDKRDRIVSLEKTLKNFVLNEGIEPIFGYFENRDSSVKNRTIYQFTTEKKGNYELLFNIRNWNDYFKQSFEEPLIFQVDGKLVSRSGKLKNNNELISFGYFSLTAGKHEFGWNALEQINLIDAPSEFLMKVDHGVFEKSFPIKVFDPYSTYVLSVNYLIKKGSGLQVSIEGNNDPIKDGVTNRQFLKNLEPEIYDFDQKNYTAYYLPSTTSDAATLIFGIFPWNNCVDIYWTKGKDKCEKEEVRRSYDRTTEILIKDASLVKIMTEVPFLRLEDKSFVKNDLPEINFTKVSEAEYKINIKRATGNYALILSELYDPGWKVLTKDGTEIAKSHFLANGYANGWIIDKKGSYEIFVKFVPQDSLNKGQTISIISVILGVAILSINFIKAKNEK